MGPIWAPIWASIWAPDRAPFGGPFRAPRDRANFDFGFFRAPRAKGLCHGEVPKFSCRQKGGSSGGGDSASKRAPLGGPIWAPIWGPVRVPDRAPIGAPRGSPSGPRKWLPVRGPKRVPNLIYTTVSAIFGPSKKGSNWTLWRGPIWLRGGARKSQKRGSRIPENVVITILWRFQGVPLGVQFGVPFGVSSGVPFRVPFRGPNS